MKQAVKTIMDSLSVFLNVLKVVFRPRKSVAILEKIQEEKLLAGYVGNVIVCSLVLSVLQEVFNFNKFGDGFVKITFFLFITSVIFLPTVLVQVWQRRKHLRGALFLSAYLSSALQLIINVTVSIFFLVFLKSEKYFFFYGSLVIGALTQWFVIIYWSVLLNTAKKLRVTVVAVLVTLGFGFLTSSLLVTKNNDDRFHFDPVFDEFYSNDIFNEVDLTFYLEAQVLAIEILQSNVYELDARQISQLDDIAEIASRSADGLAELEKSLTYRLSKDFVTVAIESTEILEEIVEFSKKVRQIPATYKDTLEDEIQKLGGVQANLDQMISHLDQILTHLEALKLSHATHDSRLIMFEYLRFIEYMESNNLSYEDYQHSIEVARSTIIESSDTFEQIGSDSNDVSLNNLINKKRNELVQDLIEMQKELQESMDKLNRVINLKSTIGI